MESGDVQASRDALKDSFAPRVERTRAKILAAVQTLAEEGQELTVTAVGRTAGISRATFYAHYGGLDGLAKAVWGEAFSAIDDMFRFDVHTTPDAVHLAYQRLVAHFADHRTLYAAVAALPVSKESYLANVRAWATVIEQTLLENLRGPTDLHPPATARYVAGAVYGLLDAWVSGEIDLTEAQLFENLIAMHSEWRTAGA